MPRLPIPRRHRRALQTGVLFASAGMLLFRGVAGAQTPLKPKPIVASSSKTVAAANRLTAAFGGVTSDLRPLEPRSRLW